MMMDPKRPSRQPVPPPENSLWMIAGSAATSGFMESGSSSGVEWVVRDNPERRRFEIDLGDALAIAEYTLPKGTIMFTHTEVPPHHGGKGIGGALIRAGLAAARERGLKVIPICPFFAAYMKRHEEEQDLLDPTWRRKLLGVA
jgi:uncharacterized protein